MSATEMDGRAGPNGVVKRWDARTFAPQKSIAGGGAGVFDFDFSPDRRRLLTIGFDGEIHLWDLATAEAGLTFNVGGVESAARFTVGGPRLCTVGGDLQLEDAGTAEHISRLPPSAKAAVLSSDGSHVLTAIDGQPILYSLRLADYVAAACSLLAITPPRCNRWRSCAARAPGPFVGVGRGR